MALYHKDIGFPKGILIPSMVRKLRYSDHALHAAETDRYENFRAALPSSLKTFYVVEIESDDNEFPMKLVVRTPLNARFDIVMVICPIGDSFNNFSVKTVWLNKRTDKHRTLDKSRYSMV